MKIPKSMCDLSLLLDRPIASRIIHTPSKFCKRRFLFVPRTRQSPDVRRAALIEAAVTCLVELGPTEISTRTIAARAGVSSGLLGYYFESKEDLLAAAYRSLS
jgi:hypothetical protein